jgi:hypothetical protein
MTYCTLLALAVLRDEYALLDRTALMRMKGAPFPLSSSPVCGDY